AKNLLIRWSDHVRDHGYRKDAPWSNYGAGGYVSRMLTALALSEGRDSEGPRLIREMTTYRKDLVVPIFTERGLKGGFWSEGWNYGPLALTNVLLAGLAYESAGLGTATAERQWAGEVILCLIHGQPSKTT